MTLESKCQMTKENKSTDFFFFYFISKLGMKLHKKDYTALEYARDQIPFLAEVHEATFSCEHGEDGSVAPL